MAMVMAIAVSRQIECQRLDADAAEHLRITDIDHSEDDGDEDDRNHHHEDHIQEQLSHYVEYVLIDPLYPSLVAHRAEHRAHDDAEDQGDDDLYCQFISHFHITPPDFETP